MYLTTKSKVFKYENIMRQNFYAPNYLLFFSYSDKKRSKVITYSNCHYEFNNAD